MLTQHFVKFVRFLDPLHPESIPVFPLISRGRSNTSSHQTRVFRRWTPLLHRILHAIWTPVEIIAFLCMPHMCIPLRHVALS